MKEKPEIEAVLERSLRKQVSVPRLDNKFDASVWARIEAAETRAPVPTQRLSAAPKAARWLYFVNVVGLAIVAIFVSLFGAQMLAGTDFAVSLSEMSFTMSDRTAANVSTGIAAAAVIFGLLYTPWGRRLREELG